MEDYKQKYEEALERAKKYYNRELYAECNGSLVEDIFPELCESEDEKIRNEIIQSIQDNMCGIHKDKCIAWLEKQAEQKPNFCHHEVDFSDCSEEYRKAYYDGWNNCNQQHAQLEAEQKPAWSEKDERNITGISMVLQSWDSYHVSSAGLPSLIPEYISWLYSLKEKMKGK